VTCMANDVMCPPVLTVIEARPPEFSDESLALEFATLHEGDLRYVAPWGQWFEWDGTRWVRDHTLRGFDLARAICRAASARCNSATLAKTIASATTVAAVERLAKADRRLAATTEQWDRDPWLLNTPGGTVNLRSGQVREHRRDDYCTKITAVAPGGACPRWLAFIAQCAGGDQELVAFLARMAGLALTGITRDHAMFFLYGQGGNGKSVFSEAITGGLGGYSVSAPIETFIATNSDRHPTELARLRSARLVTSSEAEQDRYWNESRMKQVTGDGRISARFMHQDFFEYEPQFKLWVSGNYRPKFRGVNNAIRRRLHLVPFTVTIPKDQIDKSLSEKLREEWPGILSWMIAGCMEWQQIGLAPPPAVRDATDHYLENEDTFGQWIDACCAQREGTWSPTSTLWASWYQFALECGEEPGSQKLFAQRMEARGIAQKRINTGRGFSGVILKR